MWPAATAPPPTDDVFGWGSGPGAGVSSELCALLGQTIVFVGVLLAVDCHLLRPGAIAAKRVYNRCRHYGQFTDDQATTVF